MRLRRRDFLQIAAAAGTTLLTPAWARRAWAEVLATGLSDPALQPKFAYHVPNALDPAFRNQPDGKGRYKIALGQGTDRSGPVDAAGRLLSTPIFGYGDGRGPTWPGRTFEVKSARAGGFATTEVQWKNQIQSSRRARHGQAGQSARPPGLSLRDRAGDPGSDVPR